MSEKRVTIGDISSALGISASTVSRALSGRGYVAAEVKTRIHEAARRMGYVPDLTARNLRQRSSSTIGLVVTTLLDPFYPGYTVDIVAYDSYDDWDALTIWAATY